MVAGARKEGQPRISTNRTWQKPRGQTIFPCGDERNTMIKPIPLFKRGDRVQYKHNSEQRLFRVTSSRWLNEHQAWSYCLAGVSGPEFENNLKMCSDLVVP